MVEGPRREQADVMGTKGEGKRMRHRSTGSHLVSKLGTGDCGSHCPSHNTHNNG